MSVEREAVARILGGRDLDWELAIKRSIGASSTRRRGEAELSERWSEEALTVRVRLPDGRSSLSSSAGVDDVERTAELALEDASRQRWPPAPAPDFAEAWPAAPSPSAPGPSSPGPAAPGPPSFAADDLAALLDEVLEGASTADARVSRLELGRARRALVTTQLFNSKGLELETSQELAVLEAELIGREIERHAGSFDAEAAPRLDEADARALGERLGRAVRRQLDGLPRGPGVGGALLAPAVVAEITFRLAPALLGLEAGRSGEEGPVLACGLRLFEDSAEDEAARSVPADGVGRRLELLDLAPGGRLEVPEVERLPLVRPGIADPPSPGWLRLSWSCESGSSDEQLISRLGTGLLLERVVTDGIDPKTLGWRGRAEGWWVEDGVARRPVARLPLEVSLADLLPALRAVGGAPRNAHPSGTVRAVPWLLDELPGRSL